MNYELNKLYKFVNKNYLFKLYREKKLDDWKRLLIIK